MFAPDTLISVAAPAVQEKGVSSWFDEHGQTLVVTPLRILAIIVVALVLRAVARRLITQFISRMSNRPDGPGRPVTGFLLNAERRSQRAETVGSVLRNVASFVILGIASLMVLSEFEVDLAPLLAGAGIVGVALGFGARNLVSDFLSGIFMILEDQYGVGDLVDVGAASGAVMEVGLRITKLRADDGTIWYVRNGEIKRIGNRSQGWGTATLDVQVGYREDVEKVREIILTTAEHLADDERFGEIVWGAAEVMGMEAISASSMVLQVQTRTMPGQELKVARELRARLKRAFDDAGIRVSAPVVTTPASEEAGVGPEPGAGPPVVPPPPG